MSSALTALAPSSGEMPARPQPADGVDQRLTVESSPLPSQPGRGAAIIKRRPARVKPPKDSKIYKVVLAVVAMRAQGVKAKEISDQLGYSEDTLRQYVSRAYKKGWITIQSFTDVDDKLEYVLKHKIVENVHAALGERTEDGDLTSGAREMTLEAAKGLGMFKTHQVVKGDVSANIGVALRVQVEMPPVTSASQIVSIRPGTAGGQHAIDIPVDAEIVESSEEN